MRIRATAVTATVTGALALTAIAVPAAQADDSLSPKQSYELVKKAEAGSAAKTGGKAGTTGATTTPSTRSLKSASGPLDITFSKVKVNNGKALVVGTSKSVTVPTTFTVKHGPGAKLTSKNNILMLALYRGTFDDPQNMLFSTGKNPTCTKVSSTVDNCKSDITVDPTWELENADAGAGWKAEGLAVDYDGQNPESPDLDWGRVGVADQGNLAKAKVQRYVRLSTDATPEPVKKGKTITVTGSLTRANWESGKYAGYTKQSVKLQYHKKGVSTYKTLKTVKTDSKGKSKTTEKATADGYFRYSFAGTSTTPAINSVSDYVDVK